MFLLLESGLKSAAIDIFENIIFIEQILRRAQHDIANTNSFIKHDFAVSLCAEAKHFIAYLV